MTRRLTKQIPVGMKPFLAFGEGIAKPDSGYQVLNKTGRQGPKARKRQGTVMIIKTLSAISAVAFAAATLAILPGFAPQVEASVPQALAKSDRLDIRPIGRGCSEQAWPNFEASCLRGAGSKVAIHAARVVSEDRAR